METKIYSYKIRIVEGTGLQNSETLFNNWLCGMKYSDARKGFHVQFEVLFQIAMRYVCL